MLFQTVIQFKKWTFRCDDSYEKEYDSLQIFAVKNQLLQTRF